MQNSLFACFMMISRLAFSSTRRWSSACCLKLASCLAYSSTLKMETTCSPEMYPVRQNSSANKCMFFFCQYKHIHIGEAYCIQDVYLEFNSYKCQCFRCPWCGGDHQNWECLEKNNGASKLKCCNYEEQHPCSYRVWMYKERAATLDSAFWKPSSHWP
jgi:hypothetical protein